MSRDKKKEMVLMNAPRSLKILAAVSILSLAVVVGIGFTARGDSNSGTTTTKRMLLGMDLERALTFDDLVGESTLVIQGVPTGPVTFKQLTSSGGDYYQTVRVEAVYKGTAPGAVRVLRFGVPGGSGIIAEDAGGPLPDAPGVYFLQPSAKPGVYQVTGHTQGVLVVGPEGRIVDVGKYGFPALKGLTPDAVRQKVEAQ